MAISSTGYSLNFSEIYKAESARCEKDPTSYPFELSGDTIIPTFASVSVGVTKICAVAIPMLAWAVHFPTRDDRTMAIGAVSILSGVFSLTLLDLVNKVAVVACTTGIFLYRNLENYFSPTERKEPNVPDSVASETDSVASESIEANVPDKVATWEEQDREFDKNLIKGSSVVV